MKNTKTEAAPLLSAKKEVRLPCPCCNEPAACVAVNIFNLDNHDELFTCCDCQASFGPDEVRDMLARTRCWLLVLSWVDGCPQFDDE